MILVQKIDYVYGGYPHPFPDKFFGKTGVTDLGVPPPPFMDTIPKIFLQNGLKFVSFTQKNMILVQKKVTDMGVAPPPFTDKIRNG